MLVGWLVGFTASQLLLGFLSQNQIKQTLIVHDKKYLPNHFKQLNTSYLV